MWCDMNNPYSFDMAAVISIISRCGLRNEAHHRSQPIKSKLVLFKPLLQLQGSLEQLYISNKMEHLSYEGGVICMGNVCISINIKEELVKSFKVL